MTEGGQDSLERVQRVRSAHRFDEPDIKMTEIGQNIQNQSNFCAL
jgi:hypothetical protein